MEGSPLTAGAFLVLVDSHIRDEGARLGLGELEASKPGLWMHGPTFARIIPWTDGGFSVLLHRLGGDYRSRVIHSLNPTSDEAKTVAHEIVLHLNQTSAAR